MLERVTALSIYPEGVATKEWTVICENVMPEWEKAVLQVKILATAYKSACADLLKMHDTLKDTRDEIKRITERTGCTSPIFRPVLTVGLDSGELIVSKGDYIRLAGIDNPLTGVAI